MGLHPESVDGKGRIVNAGYSSTDFRVRGFTEQNPMSHTPNNPNTSTHSSKSIAVDCLDSALEDAYLSEVYCDSYSSKSASDPANFLFSS